MAEPERRRRRPPLSCVLCRRRKIRCNRESPCNNCLRSKGANCIYDDSVSRPRRPAVKPGLAPGPLVSPYSSTSTDSASTGITAGAVSGITSEPSPQTVSSTATSALSSQQSSRDIEFLKSRINQLEEKLSKANQRSSQAASTSSTSSIEAISSHIGGTFYIHHDNSLAGQPQSISRGVMHKSRLFGQSHWVTSLSLVSPFTSSITSSVHNQFDKTQVRDILGLIEPYARETSKIFILMQKAKSLARIIKTQRAPPWPLPPATNLPSKDVADELVDRYFRVTETTYRILHIPTFRRDYEAYWVSRTQPNTAFLVQLKLVLAIGATTYDEKFSLRADAMRWVYEAQTWIAEPGFKHRLNIQFLQNNILLLLAREFVDVCPDLVWISAGTLVRLAVYMGLHRDPTHLPKMSTFTAEMRRRLWNTILELSLQLSLTSGGPPFISSEIFNTEPPGNFDDEQLTTEDPSPKPEGDFTQTSIAIALRKTFATRLAVTRFLNDYGSSNTYEEALRLDAELRASYKAVFRTLQGYKSGAGSRSLDFEMGVVNLFLNRSYLSLHALFFSPTTQEAIYAFSRQVVTETSLKIWRTVFPSSFFTPSQPYGNTASSGQHDLARLVICASGFFRILVLQASLIVTSELTAQLQEDETIGPAGFVRQDLLSVMSEAEAWCLKCIEAGETSIKGHFFASLYSAYIKGLMQGLGKEELSKYMISEGEEAEEKSLPLLEQMLAQGQPEGVTEELGLATPSHQFEDWDLTMSDALFEFGDTETINWGFDESLQGLPFI